MTIKTVLTIAAGAKVYQRLAYALARSFRVHHPRGDVGFVLVTDHPEDVPHDLSWVTVRPVLAESKDAFCHKLYLDKYVSGLGQTLFVDADSLIFGSLIDVFDLFQGRHVSAVGGHISEGDWCGDVSYRCRKLALQRLPVFNGGMYYINTGPVADAIFHKARELRNDYDELGIALLAGHHNEEPLVSLAMEIYREDPIQDDATIKIDAMFVGGEISCSVRQGATIDSLQNRMWHEDECGPFHPRIVHFNAFYTERVTYLQQSRLLGMRFRFGLPWWCASLLATAASIPAILTEILKTNLRPIYRKFFGVRAIKQGERGKALKSR